jgi:hypothetical protein
LGGTRKPSSSAKMKGSQIRVRTTSSSKHSPDSREFVVLKVAVTRNDVEVMTFINNGSKSGTI